MLRSVPLKTFAVLTLAVAAMNAIGYFAGWPLP